VSFSIVLINGLSTTATVIDVAGPPAAVALCVAEAAPPDDALAPVAVDAPPVAEEDADALGFEDPHADRTIAPTNATASTGTVGARCLIRWTCTGSSLDGHNRGSRSGDISPCRLLLK
jgi:hypothetical protein